VAPTGPPAREHYGPAGPRGEDWLYAQVVARAESGISAPDAAARLLVPALVALAAGAIAIGLAVAPTAGALFAGLAAIGVLAVQAPPYAFMGALLLFGIEGTIKMRLTVEGAPEPLALGAGAIDVALVMAVLGLLARDRGRSLVRLWQRIGRGGRAVSLAFAAWVGLAVAQTPVGGDLVDGLEGLRLVYFYLLALPGGAMLAAQLPSGRVEQALLAVFLAIAGYAALRGIIGPAENEREFAHSRAPGSALGEQPRDTGSFTSPVALVSFLVPASAFALALVCVSARRRAAAAVVFLMAMGGIVASYVRTAIVAAAAGAAALAALLLVGRQVPRALKLVVTAVALAVLVGGYQATLLAGEADPVAEHRAKTFFDDPFGDPSVEERLDIWGRAVERVADQPFGTGVGTVGRATVEGGSPGVYTDNSYVKILHEQGFPGALLFLFAVGGAVALCWLRLARAGPTARPLGVAALVGVIAFLALCVMGEYIEQPGKELVWALLGIAAWEAYGR
jgi:O-antigen ligase